ncbi:hypothetical protein PoB_003298900 [Plakobranchus ocellatus]|uniref:Uncharacterized protein n=1 Tax=Plakobranchus ocellatus TaxID=259542 RepID=A0AAV4AFM7_9GAST|nr:hypothetical protein PoB_003298900 [Plakobranchus ocellatus]
MRCTYDRANDIDADVPDISNSVYPYVIRDRGSVQNEVKNDYNNNDVDYNDDVDDDNDDDDDDDDDNDMMMMMIRMMMLGRGDAGDEKMILMMIMKSRGVGGTVASESALRSAGTPLSRVRAPPPAPWPDGGPESLRSPGCGLAIYKNQTKPSTLPSVRRKKKS